LKKNLQHILFSRYGLLALAVVAFVLSFVFNSYYNRFSSVNVEKKALTSYLQKKEADFNQFSKDTLLLRKILQGTEGLDEFKSMEFF